jgi:ankyrin repeat protein
MPAPFSPLSPNSPANPTFPHLFSHPSFATLIPHCPSLHPHRNVVASWRALIRPNAPRPFRPPQHDKTALIFAAQFGQLDFIDKLLYNGADIEAKGELVISPSAPSLATSHRIPRVFTQMPRASLLAFISITSTHCYHNPSTIPASHSPAGMHIPSIIAKPPVHTCCQRHILPTYQRPTTAGEQGFTALLMATNHKQTAVAERLIEKGANVNVKGIVHADCRRSPAGHLSPP